MELYRDQGICPCKVCEDRYVGCHPKCDQYITWKDNHEKNRKEHFKNKIVDRVYYGHLMDTQKKLKKGK